MRRIRRSSALHTYRGCWPPADRWRKWLLISSPAITKNTTPPPRPHTNTPPLPAQPSDESAQHDSLALAAVVDPSILTTSHLHVDVENIGRLTAGMTVVDHLG